MAQLTAEYFLKNKDVISQEVEDSKQEVVRDITIQRFGGEITVKSIRIDKFNKILRECNGDEIESAARLLYDCSVAPNFKENKELRTEYNCKTNPYGVIRKMFTDSELLSIGDYIAAISNLGNENEVKLVEDIKN